MTKREAGDVTEHRLTPGNRTTEGELAAGRGFTAESEPCAPVLIDKLVRAQVARKDIQMLVKLVEGLGHLGVVTTLDKMAGEVLIQTTQDCWPELRLALEHMPCELEIYAE